MEAPTPAMKSRRFILESLLRPQVVPWCSSGGERFLFYTLTQVNTSSRKQRLSIGYSAAGSEAALRPSEPLQWLGFGRFGREISHSPSLSFIFLAWGV